MRSVHAQLIVDRIANLFGFIQNGGLTSIIAKQVINLHEVATMNIHRISQNLSYITGIHLRRISIDFSSTIIAHGAHPASIFSHGHVTTEKKEVSYDTSQMSSATNQNGRR